MASENREIGDVVNVVLETSGDLTVSEGEPALVIHAPKETLDRLTSDVDGDTLTLSVTPGLTATLGEVRYELTLPDLEAIDLNGSGDVEATVSSEREVRLHLDGSGDVEWTGLKAEKVEIRLAGSGDVAVRGSTTELSVEVTGSGGVNGEELQAEDVVVAIAGSGDVSVSAETSLSAEISGSGRVSYSGDPSVHEEITGSGDIVQR
jgi:hypothetical protein